MATRKRDTQVTGNAAGMATDSDPATMPRGRDRAQRKAADTEAVAAAMPENPNKAAEHGAEAGVAPPEGARVEVPDDVGASTLSEGNANAKTGAACPAGLDFTPGPLAAVRVDAGGQPLTTNFGVRIADNQNSLKAGTRGPSLLKDFVLREKITHFDHERIPERIVHARGSGAHGFFEAYESAADLTMAAPLQAAGKRTPVFVRFSTVAGERGSKDTARDVRGFAVKFYTEDGIWDIVGNNIPVFFIQDAMKFPDLVHSVKPEPHHGMPQAASAHDTFWDFVSLMPESTHMLLWVKSDRAIPRSFRMMQGFGVHTFRLVAQDGSSRLAKFHWTPKLGTHSLTWDEAVKISGADPDYHRRDLWEAIEAGEFPEWEFGVQVFTDEEAAAFSFDVLDPTKLVPEELVPVRPLGRLVLDRNPDNFFAETEQVAFGVQNVIPGIDFTNDPLLAGRIHSYFDTQLSRLGGPNFHQIPINAPTCPVHNNQRDGLHQHAVHRGRVSYEPNSLGGGCPFQAGLAGFVAFPEPVVDFEVRAKPEKFAEHFAQATLFYRSQSPAEQRHIEAAFRFELSKVTVPAVRTRVLSLLANVDENLAASVAEGLGMPVPAPAPRLVEVTPEVTESPALSLLARPGDGGIRTRKVAILVAHGVDGRAVARVRDALVAEGAVVRLMGPRIGTFDGDGVSLEADVSSENEPGVLFDAMVVPGGDAGVDALAKDGRVAEHLKDQFRHCKPLLVLGEARRLLEGAGIPAADGEDPGLVIADPSDEAVTRFIAAIAAHRHFDREADPPPV